MMHDSKEKELKITAEIRQKCRCYGCSGSVCSHWSDKVTLVSEIPEPVLTVQPEPSQIFRGETVTLTCDIQGEGSTYRWQCGDDRGEHDSKEKECKITAEIRQKCRCFGCRGSVCSHWSDEVTLTVSDKPRVTVKPQSSVFTGDTVTLSCDVRHSTGLRIIWYKDFQIIQSGDETVTLRDVRVSDGGQYSCGVLREKPKKQGQRVTLTVRERPKAVLRVQPDGRVFRGQTVTLTCDIQETDVTSWTYSWKKDDSQIHVSRSQEYRISSVSESHTGHYSCSGRETRGSRHTHTSDEVTLTLSGSPALIIGVTTGLSVLFLLMFLLVLLWRCKHNKGSSHLLKKTYTDKLHDIDRWKHADTVNGPSDVTYAEIDLKPVKGMKKKKKENKGKTGESSDTVYSKLTIATG
ncbi:sialoadhesin [Rhinichthys klamathensis goyatoka]|uniref:sialoadhesin n=1 Tax=Rhinichthys klamathensis goyatoka TaxID=3034132 RepID=UPI0024B533F5|nr:sialoadhesin [Rhinichthys klamathensis goyatoka]